MSVGQTVEVRPHGGGLRGAGALRLLVLLRLRGRLRTFRAGLRRPARVILLLVAVAFVAFLAWHNVNARGMRGYATGQGAIILPSFLLVFLSLSLWAATRHGVIAFKPEEVHFLFPAPVTTRALLFTHLLTAVGKSFAGAVFFSLFLRPSGVSLLWASFGYGAYVLFAVLLQVRVDLACFHLDNAQRRRRAMALAAGMLTFVALSVGVAWWLDRGVISEHLLRFALLPAAPFATVIASTRVADPAMMSDFAESGLSVQTSIVFVLGAISVLAGGILSFRGDVREAAHKNSLLQQVRIDRIRRGRILVDAPRALSGGRVLPMLPRLGGAGVHAWRQLTILSRTRKSYMLLIVMAAFMGLTLTFSGGRTSHMPETTAAAMLAVLIFVGPMYVQCDFRADYACLPWLRSLPTPAGILAAGQMLASSLVLYVLQLLLTGWSLLVCRSDHLLVWAGVYLALPIFNLLQLSVWNGFHLVYPMRMTAREGSPPGAVQVVRLYLIFIAVFAMLAAALAVAGAFGVAAWYGSGWAGATNPTARKVFTGAVTLGALGAVTAVCVWCVGRIFLRVDPARDLTD